MNYKDYQNARNAAWQILLDCQVTTLPINISALCRQLGVRVRLTDELQGTDGVSLITRRGPVILVSNKVAAARQRFTIGHELGHIVLGHVGQTGLVSREPEPDDNPLEHAANVFASRILAPTCVLWGCKAYSPEAIMQLCGISRQAAEFRAERMALLVARDKFLISPVERAVYQQFLPFIQDYTSASGS